MNCQDHIGHLYDDLLKSGETNLDIIARRLNPAEDNALIYRYCASHGIKEAALDKAVAAKELSDTRSALLGGHPQNAVEFVDLYTKKNGISIMYSGLLKFEPRLKVLFEGEEHDITEADLQNPEMRAAHTIYNSIKRDMVQVARDVRVLARQLKIKYTDAEVDDALNVWIDRTKNSVFAEALNKTSHDQNSDCEAKWRRLCEACFTGDIPLNIAVLKKFFYQIKQKMRGFEVSNHLMPVILGPQGVGKSILIKRLISPLKDFSLDVDFRTVTDDRIIDAWKYYIHVFDEMAYACKSDIETVKGNLTSSNLVRRPMRTNAVVVIDNRATSIGSSNQSLAELIADSTGNRRFAPLQFRIDSDRDVINSTDYLELLRSVDECGEDPIVPYLTELKTAQAEDSHTSMVEEWLNSSDRWPFLKELGGNSEVSLQAIYELFEMWERFNAANKRAMGRQKFRAELRRLVEAGKVPLDYVDARRAKGIYLRYTEQLSDCKSSDDSMEAFVAKWNNRRG